MTLQYSERIILDGQPRSLFAYPLDDFLELNDIDVKDYVSVLTTANWRSYVGTWAIKDSALYLVHFCIAEVEEHPAPPELLRKFQTAASCKSFPIKADWYSGKLRVPVGRLKYYKNQGFWWYEQERVIRLAKGTVFSDQLIDFTEILRIGGYPALAFSLSEDESDLSDWWPPDCDRQAIIDWLAGGIEDKAG